MRDESRVDRHVVLAVLLSTIVVLRASPAPGQEEDDESAAYDHFTQAMALYQKGNYEAALIEFKASYKAKANYKLFYNIGLTYQALHMFVESERALVEYLEQGEGELSSGKVTEVRGILAELDNVIGEIMLVVDLDGADVLVDGKKVGTTPLAEPIRLSVGHYQLRVQKDGFEPWWANFEVAGGELIEHDVHMVAEGDGGGDDGDDDGGGGRGGSSAMKGLFWTSLALTVGSGVVLGVTGGMALSKHDEFSKTYRDEEDAWRPLKDDGERLALVSDVFIGVTSAFAVAAVVFGVLAFRKGESEGEALLTPLLGPGVAGLVLGGRF